MFSTYLELKWIGENCSDTISGVQRTHKISSLDMSVISKQKEKELKAKWIWRAFICATSTTHTKSQNECFLRGCCLRGSFHEYTFKYQHMYGQKTRLWPPHYLTLTYNHICQRVTCMLQVSISVNMFICTYSDTRCRESPSAWRTEHKKYVHVSFILNNGKPSPRRACALVALLMIDPKKNPFNCTSKKDVW